MLPLIEINHLMKKFIILSCVLFLGTHFVVAQTLFRGVVLNEQTKSPIPEVKIGVSGQGVGVITAANGRFNYRKYSKTLDRDSQLIITARGYEDLVLGIGEIQELYNLNSTILLKPGSKKKKKKNDAISVFWDISEGMIERDEDKEWAFLEQHLSQYKKVNVNFVVFNDKIQTWKQEEIRNGEISSFRESISDINYSGPANYDVLQLDGIDEVLLFSNGDPTFGTLAINRNVPVYAIASAANVKEEALLEITDFTDGAYIPLQNRSLAAIKNNQASANSSESSSKTTISGQVTSLSTPLQGATINKLGTFEEAQTDNNGFFTIEAEAGDILAINYLGMFEKRVVVEDITTLQIAMIPESDVLDEVVLTGTKKDIIVGNKIMKGRPSEYFPGGTVGFGDFYITAEDIIPNARTLEQVLLQNFKAVQIKNTATQGPVLVVRGNVPAYVLNGNLLGPGEPPPFYIADTEIESLVLKYGNERTSRYSPGNLLSGPAVIVTTKNSAFVKKTDKYNPLVKGNDYQENTKLSKEAIISKKSHKIKGRVTSLGKPIQKATINVQGSFDEYYSKEDGSFTVPAQEGELIIVRYLGMYPKGVAVDAAVAEVVVDLIPKNDVLDEVKITGRNQGDVNFGTDIESRRYKDPFLGSFDVFTLTNEDFKIDTWVSIATGLKGKVSNVQVKDYPGEENIAVRNDPNTSFFIDGRPVDITEFVALPPQRVETISIKKNIVGIIGRAIFVNTKKEYKTPKPGSALATKNEYKDEVKSIARRVRSSSTTQNNSIVRGKVMSQGKAIQGASIFVKGSFDEYYSKNDGSFEIKASSGDILVVKALGMFKKEVLIEQQFDLTIELTSKRNDLDEVVVSGNTRVDNTIETAYGRENTDKLGYAVDEIKKENFNPGWTNLRQLITGKFPGVRVIGNTTGFSGSAVIYQIRGGNQSIENNIPPAWIVNGVLYSDEPDFIDVQQIESISVLKSTIATNKYGTLAAGGAFVISTIKGASGEGASSRPSALVSGNNYVNDAIAAESLNEQEYITQLRQIPSLAGQFEAYRKMARTKELSLEFYSDMARYFQNIDLQLANDVRSDLAYVARKNPKALRTLAYLYEEAGDTKKTLLTYEKVLELVPNEAQSYRDVANAYVLNQEYNKALEVYINTIGERIKGVDFTGIEKVLKTELSRLVQLYKDRIDFSRLPNEWLRADFKQDVRMVIEWSDATVPFEFQFVNPEKKFFKWNHTLEENRDRLLSEQQQGFQIEEFVIDNAPRGEWIINVQYLGEEDDYILPPFLKYTLYRDYGTPQETKEVRVIKLFRQTEKVTLARLEI